MKKMVNGQLVDMTADEIAARNAEIAGFDAEKAAALPGEVRAERDARLAATDWRVLKATETGVALSQGWLDYRQDLRDVPDQTGFPSTVNWPSEPTS